MTPLETSQETTALLPTDVILHIPRSPQTHPPPSKVQEHKYADLLMLFPSHLKYMSHKSPGDYLFLEFCLEQLNLSPLTLRTFVVVMCLWREYGFTTASKHSPVLRRASITSQNRWRSIAGFFFCRNSFVVLFRSFAQTAKKSILICKTYTYTAKQLSTIHPLMRMTRFLPVSVSFSFRLSGV